MKKIWISLILLTLIFSGCNKPVETGLLDEYKKLKKTDSTTLMYKVSSKPLEGYKSILIQPVVMEFNDSGIRQEIVDSLQQYIELSSRKVVLSEFDIATKAGKNIAVLEATLLTVTDDSPIASNIDADNFRGHCLEVKVYNSVTNETLISMVLAQPEIKSSGLSKWNKAKITIEFWSNQMAVALYCNEDEPCPAAERLKTPIIEDIEPIEQPQE